MIIKLIMMMIVVIFKVVSRKQCEKTVPYQQIYHLLVYYYTCLIWYYTCLIWFAAKTVSLFFLVCHNWIFEVDPLGPGF